MREGVPSVLVPIPVTDAVLTSSTVTENDHPAWVTGGTYAVGDRRIRTQTHRIYECLQAHTGIATAPEDDPTRWQDLAPTNKWAMFDTECSTQTVATTSLTVVLAPGFFNAVSIYKLTGTDIGVTVKDAPGGAVVFSYSGSLDGPYGDWYEWLFGPYRIQTKLILSDILPYPNAELTITITAGVGEAVGVGMVAIGDLRPLLLGDWGGTEYGCTVEPVDYSYISIDEFGETKIKKRRNATDMRISVVLPKDDATYALAIVQEVLAVPAAWIATTAPGFDGLNVFGLGSSRLSYDSNRKAILQLNVKGLI